MKKILCMLKRSVKNQSVSNSKKIEAVKAYLLVLCDEVKHAGCGPHNEILYKINHKTFAKVCETRLELRHDGSYRPGFMLCTIHGKPSSRYMTINLATADFWSIRSLSFWAITSAIDDSIEMARS